MPNPNHEKDDSETGAHAGSSSGEQSSTSIGRLKPSDGAQNRYRLFSSHTPHFSSNSLEKIPFLSTSVDTNRNNVFRRTRYGFYKPAMTKQQYLELLIERLHLDTELASKAFYLQILYNFLAKEENQHFRSYSSNKYNKTPLDAALEHNKNGFLNDEINKLLAIDCTYHPKNKHLLPKQHGPLVDLMEKPAIPSRITHRR